jgi:hypothetical protein
MNTCFVMMAIGDQEYNDVKVTSAELKEKYSCLIKDAIKLALPGVEVTRADEVAVPGTITSDIITRIMHSDLVVADVTYPNPNVYYELGLRHASKPGTIIIKDNAGPSSPFDIAHLRHIPYDNTPPGIKKLAAEIKKYSDHYIKVPQHPDNQFLELAKLTKFSWPDYGPDEKEAPEVSILMSLFQSPELLELMMKHKSGEEINEMELLKLLMATPDVSKPLIEYMAKSGNLKFEK